MSLFVSRQNRLNVDGGFNYADGGRTEFDGFERIFDLKQTTFRGKCAANEVNSPVEGALGQKDIDILDTPICGGKVTVSGSTSKR